MPPDMKHSILTNMNVKVRRATKFGVITHVRRDVFLGFSYLPHFILIVVVVS